MVTLHALERCKKELGVRTILGVSNISFGLPNRSALNAAFLTAAMYAGLDAAIMNPQSQEMMAAVAAYDVLTGRDAQSQRYIARYAAQAPAAPAAAPSEPKDPEQDPYGALIRAVEQGLAGQAAAQTRELLAHTPALTVVDKALVPALDQVGGVGVKRRLPGRQGQDRAGYRPGGCA